MPVSNWTGRYVGFEIGEKWTPAVLRHTVINLSSFSPFNCGGTANPFSVDSSSPHRFNNSGVRTGFYLGAQSPSGNIKRDY